MKHFLFLILFGSIGTYMHGQQKEVKPFSLEANYFTGSILEHNPDIAHLITELPRGLILAYNRKTYGFNEWEARYRYPDWGFTFAYQDMVNPILGENYALYGHFTWYYFQRHFSITVGQGVAYNTNPYDPETNFKNNAYGSDLLSSTYLRFSLVKENLFKGFGVNLGAGVIHYSNANFKAPNNSTNTFFFNVGTSYQFDEENFPARISTGGWRSSNYAEPYKINVAFMSGVNEADVNGLGQYPFYTLSVFADKRINYKSTFQFGVDVYFSQFLIELIKFRRKAFPEDGLKEDIDYRRIGLFIGHELRFNKVAFVSQVGYYTYWPYEFENRIYNRLGLKRYFFDDRFFASVTVKAHYAKAEAVEFGVGYRFKVLE